MNYLKPITQRTALLIVSALGFLLASFGSVWAHGRPGEKEAALGNRAETAAEVPVSNSAAKKIAAKMLAAPGHDTYYRALPASKSKQGTKSKDTGLPKRALSPGEDTLIYGGPASKSKQRTKFKDTGLPKSGR